MYKGEALGWRIISIVLSWDNKIHYSNIDKEETAELLKRLGIPKVLTGEFPAKYDDLEGYSVEVGKFFIGDKPYYLMNITKYHECFNCKKNCPKALIDMHTGLYNRNYWEQISSGEICHLSWKSFSLILIDIDNLKEINDLYGHLTGDEAIGIVGGAIKNSIRKDDIGIRYGGDEFLVLLFNQDKGIARKVTERIRRKLREDSKEKGVDIQISAGIASDNFRKDMKNIIKMADKDLYSEKDTKKSHEEIEKDKLKYLHREIEQLRNELNDKIACQGKKISDNEILNLSRKLDDLIIRCMMDGNQR